MLVNKCRLHPKLASSILFILFTLPCIFILGTILYYRFTSNQPYDTKEDCMKYDPKIYGIGVCNVWDENEQKCYKGLYNDSKECDKNMIKNIPISVYIGSVLIILANISFYFMKSKCY
jgi:hypothetical protein